jgi:hypothetical protein
MIRRNATVTSKGEVKTLASSTLSPVNQTTQQGEIPDMKKYLTLALALILGAGVLFASSAGASESTKTDDPYLPVRLCASGNDYTEDAYAVPGSTIVAVAQIADRADLAEGDLTMEQQDERAALIVQYLGTALLPCGHAFAACATTSAGTTCFQPAIPEPGPLEAGDVPVLIEVPVTTECVVTEDNSCTDFYLCSPATAAALLRHDYNLGVLGGIGSVCTPTSGVGVPPIAPTPTPTPDPTPVDDVEAPPVAFTG